jgi:hypothetical protein
VFKKYAAAAAADICVTPSGLYWNNKDGWHQFILIYKQLLM